MHSLINPERLRLLITADFENKIFGNIDRPRSEPLLIEGAVLAEADHKRPKVILSENGVEQPWNLYKIGFNQILQRVEVAYRRTGEGFIFLGYMSSDCENPVLITNLVFTGRKLAKSEQILQKKYQTSYEPNKSAVRELVELYES